MSSTVLNPEKREIVLELFDYKDDIERNKLDDILTRLNVCLTIINSDNFIDIDNFEKYCKHTQIKLRLFAPWMELSTTLHMFLGSFHKSRNPVLGFFDQISKGQLISECLLGVIDFPKNNKKNNKFLP